MQFWPFCISILNCLYEYFSKALKLGFCFLITHVEAFSVSETELYLYHYSIYGINVL